MAEYGNKYGLEAIKKHTKALKDGQYSKLEYYCRDIPRHEPDLIKVVEELGEEANGNCSSLEVVDINIGYNISEYDGLESVNSKTYDYKIDI